jgi:hypothetical protein
MNRTNLNVMVAKPQRSLMRIRAFIIAMSVHFRSAVSAYKRRKHCGSKKTLNAKKMLMNNKMDENCLNKEQA